MFMGRLSRHIGEFWPLILGKVSGCLGDVWAIVHGKSEMIVLL